MQVQSTQNTTANYDNSIQKSQETSSSKFDMTKPFDINTFSFEDYKNISSSDLHKWLEPESDTLTGDAIHLFGLAHYTDDDTFNKILFNKAQSSLKQSGNLENFNKNFMSPLLTMTLKMPSEMPNRMIIQSEIYEENENQTNNFMERGYFFDKKEIINQIKEFPEYYEHTKDNSVWTTDINSIFKYMNDILNEYEKRTNENNATLDNYTKNSKPNVLAI